MFDESSARDLSKYYILTKLPIPNSFPSTSQTNFSIPNTLPLQLSNLPDLTLLLYLQRPSLKLLRISRLVSRFIRESYEERSISEEIIHLFEWETLSFGEEEVEEDGVGEIADDEEEVVFVADGCHCYASYLSDL